MAVLTASGMAVKYTVVSVGSCMAALVGAVLGTSVGFVVGYCTGLGARALTVRAVATIRNFPTGVTRVPDNWRENNFLTDFFTPAELMPGITDFCPSLSFEAYVLLWAIRYEKPITPSDEPNRFDKFVIFLMVSTLFIPVLAYRLNLKATAWFWWPLAYMLKPAPVADEQTRQKQALCWPWTNPFQKGLIVATVFLVLISLIAHNFDSSAWAAMKHVPVLPLALKVALAMDWAHIAPWHWAQWIIAGTGAGMLALAGNARSHEVNGNWQEYARSWPRNIRLMTSLQRLRTLASIALLVMSLGALLLQDRAWLSYVPLPDRWIVALEHFYRTRA